MVGWLVGWLAGWLVGWLVGHLEDLSSEVVVVGLRCLYMLQIQGVCILTMAESGDPHLGAYLMIFFHKKGDILVPVCLGVNHLRAGKRIFSGGFLFLLSSNGSPFETCAPLKEQTTCLQHALSTVLPCRKKAVLAMNFKFQLWILSKKTFKPIR